MPRSPDIVIIGAGIVGCSIAYELAARGASVQVVEERSVGVGATRAAAGILAPHVEISAHPPFLNLAVRSLNLYDDFIARVGGDSGIAIPYRRTGTLQVARNDEGLRELKDAAARLASFELPGGASGMPGGPGATGMPEILDAQAVRVEEPNLSHDVIAGLVVPAHGFVAAGDLVRAVAAAAKRHGAQVIEGRKVHRVSSVQDALVLETDQGPLTSSTVVLAAGSWSGQIGVTGTPPAPLKPIRGQLLRLAWKGPTLRRIIWGDRCYLVPWDDGTLLVGATVEDAGFDERTTAAGVRELLDAACEIVPGAREAGFLEARAGLRPAAADLLPIIGRSRVLPNLMYATAHYRNGILLAPLTARVVADALLDDRLDPALAAFAPQRFGEF